MNYLDTAANTAVELSPKHWTDSTKTMMNKVRRYSSQLQATLATDSAGRPTALVNPQAVLATGMLQEIEDFIDNPPEGVVATIAYMEGMPTIFGVPIWERLENEPMEYYTLFRRYREMHEAKKSRSVYKLSIENDVSPKHLEVLRQTYHWQLRVAAYDEYVVQERQLALEQRRIEIEGNHSKIAEQIFGTCTKYFFDNPDHLNPKTALQWAELAVKLQRISVGLMPDRPGTVSGDSRPLININNNVSGSATTADNGTGVTGNTEEDKNRLKQVLNIMNNIGLIQQETPVVEGEVVELEE